MKSVVQFALAAVVAAGMLFSSCGKYPDGPKISFKSRMARITREWTDASCTSNCSTTEYKKDGTILSNGQAVSGLTWKFSSDGKNLEISGTVFNQPYTSTAQIRRLTSKELWLESNGSTTVDKFNAK